MRLFLGAQGIPCTPGELQLSSAEPGGDRAVAGVGRSLANAGRSHPSPGWVPTAPHLEQGGWGWALGTSLNRRQGDRLRDTLTAPNPSAGERPKQGPRTQES